jgi:hypothetical protein
MEEILTPPAGPEKIKERESYEASSAPRRA